MPAQLEVMPSDFYFHLYKLLYLPPKVIMYALLIRKSIITPSKDDSDIESLN